MNKQHFLRPLWLLWGGIGGYRGNQYYNIDVENKNFNQYSYVTNSACIIAYSVIYMFPPFFVLGIANEIYNLENVITKRNNAKK
jgi:hypothetical protein